jgi:CRISPR-associated protein Csb2
MKWERHCAIPGTVTHSFCLKMMMKTVSSITWCFMRALEGYGTQEQFQDSALLRRSANMGQQHALFASLALEGCRSRRRNSPDDSEPNASAEAGLSQQSSAMATAPLLAEASVSACNHATCSHFTAFAVGADCSSPDRTGLALRLEFSEGIVGPIALGFGCHLGLGLFRAK